MSHPAPGGDEDSPGAAWPAIVDVLAVALVVVDKGGGVRQLNARARRFLGLAAGARATTLARMPFVLAGGSAARGLVGIVARAREGFITHERVLPLGPEVLGSSATPLALVASAAPLGPEEGGAREVLVHWRVEPVAAPDDALRARAAQLEDVVDNAAAIIFIKGLDWRYTLGNRAFLGLFDIPTAIGLTDDDLFSPEVVEGVRRNDRAVLASRRPVRCEERVPSGGEERIFLSLKFPVFDAEGALSGLCGIATDITDSKRTEEENRRLTVHAQAAEEASRLKSTFLATMSHEIRTPLAGAIGLCGMLGDTGLTGEQRRLVDGVQRVTRDLLAILNDVLDISKLEAGKFDFEAVPLSLEDLSRELADTMGPVAREKGLGLAPVVGAGAPAFVLGDPARLRQVLLNLVNNAIKFSSGGTVEFALGTAPAPGRADGALLLVGEVRDQGAGISRADIERLFEAFSQADASISRRFGGTGLGLAICRSIVEAQGGRIGAAPRAGGGSRFWFEIPTRAAPAPPRPVGGADPPPARLAGRVLVAEDNAVNQVVILAMLARLGLAHDLACDGEAAVARARENAYDAILMDCHMPGVDGLAATATIRGMAGHEKTPIIALTANAMRGERERCLAAGMTDYLVKPVERDVLARTLARFLGPGRPRSPGSTS